jgi:DNA-binding Lrp family transcriptional regulator
MVSGGTNQKDRIDLLDLSILENLLDNGRITFKELAKQTHTDQRTIAARYQRLVKLRVIESATIQVNWAKLGLGAVATIGTTTPADEVTRRKLLQFFKTECRVLEAFCALGSHEYILRVIDKDVAILRNKVITPLEPLTSGLDTSVVVERVKSPDYRKLLEYAKGELRHPSRTGHPHRKAPPFRKCSL